MSIAENYFELFGLEPAYTLDMHKLAERFRELQKIYHPDRQAGKTPQEIRLSVQRASLVNQGYEALRSPVPRALYLLELQGVPVDGANAVTADGDFLMQQLEMRERLQEIPELTDPLLALEKLQGEARYQFSELEETFADCYARADYQQAAQTVAKMQFFVKFLTQLDDMEEKLEDV